MILYQVWVPAVAFAHALGLLWLAWSLDRLCGPALRKAARGALAGANLRLRARQTRQTPPRARLHRRRGALPGRPGARVPAWQCRGRC